jgi:uncharacterized damage-inducible protein DinB
MHDALIEGLAFDRWANRRYLQTLQEAGLAEDIARWAPRIVSLETWPTFPEDPKDRIGCIFAHIHFAQHIWLVRCGGQIEDFGPDIEGWMDALNDGWTMLTRETDPNRHIEYHNTLGQPFASTFGDILRHVLDHGTYHRGQIREAMDKVDPGKILETGFVYYAILRDAGKL